MDRWFLVNAPHLAQWAGLGSVALVAALCGLVLRAVPGLGAAVLGRDDHGRAGELDGLRGLLSLLVVMHHCVLMRGYFLTGRYEAAPGNFENLAGEGSVALFFVTTGYLYWSRMLAGARFDWVKLYAGRMLRLAPMYVVSVAVLVALVMAESRFALNVPAGQLGAEIGHWLSFTFLPLPAINGFAETEIVQVVLWTLRYEWQFVLCLPLLALFRFGALPWLLYAGALAAAFAQGGDKLLYAYFVGGMLAAHLQPRLRPGHWAALGLVALFALVAWFHHIYGPAQVALLTCVFLGAKSGAGLWGGLRARPLRFLGRISYSTYLLHHMLLYAVAHWVLGAERFASLEGWSFQAMVAAVSAAAVAFATAAYLAVERPWLPKPAVVPASRPAVAG